MMMRALPDRGQCRLDAVIVTLDINRQMPRNYVRVAVLHKVRVALTQYCN
jgi:hypothetical protein